jgi:Spy/CpxP family protein refolding chaperone
MRTINNIRVIALAAACAVGTTALVAQPPRGGPGGIAQGLLGMLGDAIDLTEAQRTQIRSIMRQSLEANQSLVDQMRALHEQERAAVKANKSEQDLRALAQQSATLLAQANGARLVAEAKAYQVLTPAQREKLDKLASSLPRRPRGPRPPQ